MKNYSLLEMRNVTLENSEEVNLKYYLVDEKRKDIDECIELGESKTFNEGDTVYGIKLVKVDSKFEDRIIEEDEVSGITLSEQVAKDLLKTLADNTVTPVVLAEVVDEWATEHLYA